MGVDGYEVERYQPLLLIGLKALSASPHGSVTFKSQQ